MRVVNDHFRVRLSRELAQKWDAGVYQNSIDLYKSYIDQIMALGIKYPGRAQPIYYMYLVPDDEFVELLKFPYPDNKRGGRPVQCYDLDGFDVAYGQSQNISENIPAEKPSIARIVNGIHEFAHNVHQPFFRSKSRILCEGFAECVPLFVMGYQGQFEAHIEEIKGMTSDQIFTAKELTDMEYENKFGRQTRVLDKSVSFDPAYISSYLFVRGYMSRIMEKFSLDKVGATQKFLEIARSTCCSNVWLIFELADAIGMDRDELLNGREMQLKMRADIIALAS
jgi:hypothetical protein